jgi:GT2 family glycosyltransferase
MNDQGLRVAILVLNYNGADCLPQCLASLRALEYSNCTTVVIDNGSHDTSFEDAKKAFPENVYIQKNENTGFAAGMNTGIQYADNEGYDFVWLMNYDAEVLPHTLTRLIGVHVQNPEIKALSPVIQDKSGSMWFTGGHINYFRMRTEHDQELARIEPYETDFLTGCAPLFSTSLLKQVGNFDERFFLYYEDADLSCRIKKAGFGLWVDPKARVIHTEKSSSNPQKLYYLVHFGLLFFALHTPKPFRAYIVAYVTIRRLVNQIKLLLGLSGAHLVAQAYADYFRKFQAGDQLYLRKLS